MLKRIKVYSLVILQIVMHIGYIIKGIVEESMHVVFDETNPKLQDQVPKNANDEDILLEK